MERDYEGEFLAHFGYDMTLVSDVVYDIVQDPDTGESMDSYFSWSGCDCCNLDGATRGGSVYDVRVVALASGPAGCAVVWESEAQVCGDCLCGLINGEWPDNE